MIDTISGVFTVNGAIYRTYQGSFERARPAIQAYLDAQGWNATADASDPFWSVADTDLIVTRHDGTIGVLEDSGAFYTA